MGQSQSSTLAHRGAPGLARCGRSSTLLAMLLALAGRAPAAAEDVPLPEITIDHDDVDVTSSVRVKPGVYRVVDANGDGVLRVHGDWVTVDLTGVTLDGSRDGQAADAFEGVGVRLTGSRAAAVRGGT